MVKEKRHSLGRRKIQIAKITDKDRLHVTFSKRRAGLFNKACELCILCGAEVAVIVFSPAGKAFSFGHPFVDCVLDRFLSQSSAPEICSHPLVNAKSGAGAMSECSQRYMAVLSQLEALKMGGETTLDPLSTGQFWWDSPIGNLGLHELEKFRAALEELKKNLIMRMNELLIGSSSQSGAFFNENCGEVIDDPLAFLTPNYFSPIGPFDFGSGYGPF
ncbi:PREDICTED: agamous-like MADS-box protein AGL61 [Nelumbo nucifera]|uniref:Agamous-like MADS-box protein AGL61 n=2 Tax=Nelumbo nucifera TaxID=4432 RepID=A0A1U7ZE10_NELNU|nr:PREDICTED: agamous-like MADS-box protein AGL61 [Nelumbo nucifera]DAD41609.1 TPA_asm: hypothetical protein HUJ06_015932 [Nelumbo nucifera]